jgi:hypothetical protein
MPQSDSQEARDAPKAQCNSDIASSRHTVAEKGTSDRAPSVHKLVGVRSDRSSTEQGNLMCSAVRTVPSAIALLATREACGSLIEWLIHAGYRPTCYTVAPMDGAIGLVPGGAAAPCPSAGTTPAPPGTHVRHVDELRLREALPGLPAMVSYLPGHTSCTITTELLSLLPQPAFWLQLAPLPMRTVCALRKTARATGTTMLHAPYETDPSRSARPACKVFGSPAPPVRAPARDLIAALSESVEWQVGPDVHRHRRSLSASHEAD